MSNDHIQTRDPTLVREDHERGVVVFEIDGEQYTLQDGTIVDGEGDHYFRGVVDTIQYDTATVGHDHYWVLFRDVTLGDEDVAEHQLPLGELAKQISGNALTLTQP